MSHVEQSRNTLSFATRAKEVTNTAQVNMVVSDKQLVKHLQKEVARLEAELRTPESSSSCPDSILREKEMQIQKLEMDMEEMKCERDIALSQLDELRRKVDKEQPGWKPFESPHRVVKCLSFFDQSSSIMKNERLAQGGRTRSTMGRQTIRQSATAPFMLRQEIRKVQELQEQLGEEADRAIEVLQKEFSCHRQGNQNTAETISKLQLEIEEMCAARFTVKEIAVGEMVPNKSISPNLKEEITRLHSQGNTIANLEEKLKNVEKSIDKLILSLPDKDQCDEASPKSMTRSKNKLPLALSSSSNRQHVIRSPCSPPSSRKVLESEIENMAPEIDVKVISGDILEGSEKAMPSKSEDGGDISSREGTSSFRHSSPVKMRKMQKLFQNAAEENVRSIKAYVTELKERVAKLQYQKQLLVCQVLELEANDAAGYDSMEDENVSKQVYCPVSWQLTFQEQRQQIIQLWDICHVSIIHRTQFYMLFRGDQADQIYMEVEFRRLTWLQWHLVELEAASTTNFGDEHTLSISSSIRALKQEREFLARWLNSRLSEEERDMLYIKWDIPLDGKQRKLQLVNKLWTTPHNDQHVMKSAEIVAKLVGFSEGGSIPKEMFELTFALPADKKPGLLGWNPFSNLLHL